MHGAATPKLTPVPTAIIIQACLEGTNLDDAAAMLGCMHKTLSAELVRRHLPSFRHLRAQHGIGLPSWTDDMIQRMRELHLDGLSAQLIGEQIGMSRNAVIGKAHRIGLVLGVPRTIKVDTKPRAPRPPSTLKGKPRPPRNVLPAVNALPGTRRPMVLASGARKLAAERLAKESRASDRALIDAAIADGKIKITKLPPGRAWGTGSNSWAQVAHS